MLKKISDLIEDLNKSGIRYCHWKSNFALSESLAAQTDIDLLIHRKDAILFRLLLSQLYFQPTIINGIDALPSVEHHFALDEESGLLVHVHAYFRVITGQSLTKNYRFPLEELLLSNIRQENLIRLPDKSAELVVFVIRMMLKHTSITELLLLLRYWKKIPQELKWLLEKESIEQALKIIKYWLPSLDPDLFFKCIMVLRDNKILLHRVIMGYRLRSQLYIYSRHSALWTWISGIKKFLLMFVKRLTGSKLAMIPQSGGAVIAFVGSEATGKSTLLAEMKKWLGEYFKVEQVHVGKPKSTIISFLPNLLVPLLRKILPGFRSTQLETQFLSHKSQNVSPKDYPLIYALRSVLLAYERRVLLTRAFGRAANGTIIFCDRYPSSMNGAPDGPQLSHLRIPSGHGSFRRRLAHMEARLYREIPPPDAVIYLNAPLEVTMKRNSTRSKKEPEEYVRIRHARSSKLEFGKTPLYKINTDQSFNKTALAIKSIIWNTL